MIKFNFLSRVLAILVLLVTLSTVWASADNEATMAEVHVTYLDLLGNVGLVENYVNVWQEGDDQGRLIAEELLERVDILLVDINWPGEMAEVA